MVGKTVTVYEQVSDSAGNEVSRPITIYINADPSNHAPIIASSPSEEYELPSDISSSNPYSITLTLSEGEVVEQDITVPLPPSEHDVDIVFLFDESGSMKYSHDWLVNVVEDLDSQLENYGFTSRNYGLAAFGGQGDGNNLCAPHKIPIKVGESNFSDFGSAANFLDTIDVTELEDPIFVSCDVGECIGGWI